MLHILECVEPYLVVDETLVLAGVLVGEVEGVAGELDAAGLLALAEEGVLVAWSEMTPSVCGSHPTFLFLLATHAAETILCLHSTLQMFHLFSLPVAKFPSGRNIRAISQMRSELRFSYWVDMAAVIVSSLYYWSSSSSSSSNAPMSLLWAEFEIQLLAAG